MKFSIVYKKSASEELLELPASIAHRVKNAINNLSENPRPHDCKKLKGSVNEYRIRISNYRVVYTITDTFLIITVIKIAHRKDIYR